MSDGLCARVHVANLWPDWFDQVQRGLKTREYRRRQQRDAVLDGVRRGDWLVLRETGGSDRALLCVVAFRRRRPRADGYTYVIGLSDVRPAVVRNRGGRRPALRQGWRHVTTAHVELAPITIVRMEWA